jgi:hypothetical protein
MQASLELLPQFDADHNGRLDGKERAAARAWLREHRPQRGRRGPGGASGPIDPTAHWRWYVEAVAAAGTHVATLPAGNGARPFVTSNHAKPSPRK